MSNRVMHFEIPYDDADRAKGFYREAFGWEITDIPELDYTMISTGPTDDQGMPTEPGFIGGGMADRAGQVSGPVITIDVASIDDAVANVERLGGTILAAKQQVGDMGFAAYFTDPEGNVMGLWENAQQG